MFSLSSLMFLRTFALAIETIAFVFIRLVVKLILR